MTSPQKDSRNSRKKIVSTSEKEIGRHPQLRRHHRRSRRHRRKRRPVEHLLPTDQHITGNKIDNLVLNGRNVTQLVNLAPGRQPTGQETQSRCLRQRRLLHERGPHEYNKLGLDGGDNMDNGSNASSTSTRTQAIAEFKVLTSNYGAQYGP